jgi:hypothetical protein
MRGGSTTRPIIADDVLMAAPWSYILRKRVTKFGAKQVLRLYLSPAPTTSTTSTMPVSDEAFKKVADLVADKNTLIARRSTKSEQLQLYGLYKRATVDSSQRSATR